MYIGEHICWWGSPPKMVMVFGVEEQIKPALTFRIAILVSELLERKENDLR